MKKVFSVGVIGSIIAVSGCGGLDEETIDDSYSGVTSITATFYDAAPVRGLEYFVNGVSQGYTSASGALTCDEGSSVRFKVGSIDLGTAPCASQMTTLDLAGVSYTSLYSNTEVGNLTQFIQTLDYDGYINNGIEIASGVSNLAGGEYVNFNSSTFETSYSSLVNTLTSGNYYGASDFVPRSSALNNLDSEMSSLGLNSSSNSSSSGSYDASYCAADYPAEACAQLADTYSSYSYAAATYLGNGTSCPSSATYLANYDCSTSSTWGGNCGACVINVNY